MRALIVLLVVAGCASPARIPSVRFANAPPVTAVDDRRDVPVAPAARTISNELYHFDGSFFRLLTRALELPAPRRALGVNALDEVPDSTWFTNRIGSRALTLDELRRGPATVGTPEAHKPWKVKSTKVGGGAVGFIVEDARGETWIVKFESPGVPEAETAADAIVSRLLWACGFNVPEDHVVYLRKDELVLGPKAVIKDRFGHKRPLTPDQLARTLAPVDVDQHGQMRGLASRFLDGKPIGGHPHTGVRADDPNDRIPHERRRDLRGSYAMHAWLDHVDVKEDNTLDVWIADPEDPTRHYVKHYLVDFGKGLGVMSLVHENPRDGVEYRKDWGRMLASLASVGLIDHAWERRTAPALRGVGLYDIDTFDPGGWKPSTQAYLPFRTADRFDNYWAAKIMLRFSREQLRAVVETGRLTDPRAADYLVEALIDRQRATARYWFERVGPLEQFEVNGTSLCFTDLSLEHQLASRVLTRYTIATFDRTAHPTSPPVELAPGGARSCTPLPQPGDGDGYTIVELETRRPRHLGTTYVHLARAPDTQALRVIGIWRE